MPKQLQVFASMGGTLGWMRDDVPIPMIHLFANAAPGQPFQRTDGNGGPHWPCRVCDSHGFTEDDFHDQVVDALERGPA